MQTSGAGTSRRTGPAYSPPSHRDAYLPGGQDDAVAGRQGVRPRRGARRLRDAYGRNPFGQGCLLARRLVERGVPFVEVTLSAASTAATASAGTRTPRTSTPSSSLCGVLDAGWSTLMNDLRTAGCSTRTLIVWMGEFGRTPKINENAGRDHFPNAWSTVLAGGGIKGGQAIGDTGADGERGHATGPSRCPTSSPRSSRASASTRMAEHRRQRPANPAGRSQGQTDHGDPGMTGPAAFVVLALAIAQGPAQDQAAADNAAARQLIFLAEHRPVFVRLNVTSQGKPFDASWLDSVRSIHASLDRNGDGTLTTKEADPAIVAALVRLAVGAAEIPARRAGRPAEGRQGLTRRAGRSPTPGSGPVPHPGRASGDRPDRCTLRSARPRQGYWAHPARAGGDRRVAAPARPRR